MTWPVVPLNDLQANEPRAITDGPFGSNLASRHYTDRGPRVVRLQNIGDGSFVDEKAHISQEHFESLQAHEVLAGDLLVASLGEVLPRACLAPAALGPAIVKADCIRVRLRPDVEPRWVMYAMQSPEVRRWAESHRHGVGRPRLGLKVIRQIPVPLPPLDEQRRTVALLEDHLSRLDAADASLERASRLSSAMIQSALSEGLRGTLVEDDVSEGTARDLLGGCPDFVAEDDERVWDVPDTWTWARLGDVFEVNIGATPSRAIEDYWVGDLPWVSSGEVAFGRISSTLEHIAREAAGNPLRRIHPPGTVMLAMIGEGKTRGQAAILDVTAAHNQNCASIRVSATAMLPEYIYGYLEERYIETRRGGAGAQQPALNKGAIQRFPVPIAPLGTQRRLVEAWDSVRDAAYRLRGELEAAQRRRDSLRRSLLAAAFSGQLTAETATA